MKHVIISDAVRYIGADDKNIDLFESQYVVPKGVSYNSYVILDDKIAVMDTVDARAGDVWLENLDAELDGKKPDYLVVSHMEPDHSANIKKAAEKYPDMKIVGNAKTFSMISQFFSQDFSQRSVVVAEGDVLSLGNHSLQFFMAPMVHWPEVMVAYEQQEKILFSADGFGKFGALDADEPWLDEARRYYINIVGKYGAQVQALLKKAAGLDIRMICPLHGPILKENLGYYLEKYQTWSSYEPEEDGTLIVCASIHGHTAEAARIFGDILRKKSSSPVRVADLCREDTAELISESFRYSRLVTACATYNGGLFPCMESFLSQIKSKNFQKRTVGILENGSWAPMAGKLMRAYFEGMKNVTIAEPVVTVKSAVNDESLAQMEKLADQLLEKK